ncbi:hypothetical protein SK128_013071, partial [Halocaridina rubra]
MGEDWDRDGVIFMFSLSQNIERRRERGKKCRLRYFLVFSVPQNIKILFSCEMEKKSQIVSCLHGLRFLSICWVVLGHQYLFTVLGASNIAEIPEMVNKPSFQIIAKGDLSVDTFFFMSGLLICLVTLRRLNREEKFRIVYYYCHRILRLLPPIVFTMIFVATVSGLLVSGPCSWVYQDSYLKGCRKRWWLDVTFVSNLMYSYLDRTVPKGEQISCLPHLWFVNVDMQLYLITPLLVLPLYYWKKKGPILLGIWATVSVIIPASIISANHLPPSSMLTGDPANQEYFEKVYEQPWCRASPYIIGIWTGYLLHTSKDFPKIPGIGKFQSLLGWAVSTILAISAIFGISRYNKFVYPPVPLQMSMSLRILYGSLHRALWGLALHWIVLACHWGHGGPINWFLSHPMWQPVSRLTYCIYLTSIPVQFAISSSSVTTSNYSNFAK